MLEIDRLDVYYGNIHALKGVSLRVEEGEIVTMIGANGAGKTTTLRTISALLRPRAGSIRFRGESIEKCPADEIVRRGIGHSPEGRQIFANLTVSENLDMGAYTRRDRDGIRQDREMVFGLFPRLRERLHQRGGTLSGGEQQMLAIGRALMSRPSLLLLDEPSLGIAPLLVEQIFEKIAALNREQGLTILLVEQNAHLALKVAHRAYVLETGHVELEGPAKELANDERVRAHYLGG
ncbi:MAG: ABC transporter ATP-binding protein [Planctomycetia bacterium]|nr:ABC transporter ATP-binding protein [Planctomycetia bacterium]